MRLNSEEKKNIVDTRRERYKGGRQKFEFIARRQKLPFVRLSVTLAIRAKVSSLQLENREIEKRGKT